MSELSGRVRGVVNTPTTSSASGRWSVRAVHKYVSDGVWPFIPVPGGDFESIATVTVGSGGASSIEFTSIPGTYQHLQLRVMSRANFAFAGGLQLIIRFNSDTGSNYRWHRLHGDGASVVAAANASAGTFIGLQKSIADTTTNASVFSGQIVDILDYGSSSKTTTVRAFNGYDANGIGTVSIQSGLWTNTNAVTAITLTSDGNWLQHSTAALYGIKA